MGAQTNDLLWRTVLAQLANLWANLVEASHSIRNAPKSPNALANRLRMNWKGIAASPVLILLLLVTGSGAASAAYRTIYVKPLFLFNDGYVPTPFETSLAAAWSDVQQRQWCSNGTCYSYVNLHPVLPPAALGFYQDGIPYLQDFDEMLCDSFGCQTSSDWSDIQSEPACPTGFGAGTYGTLANSNRLVACAMTLTGTDPPPEHCLSCIGNPIYAATGQKLQVEQDYAGTGGLEFTRTYRSSNGHFSTVQNQTFVDNSQPAGTTTDQCWPSYWTYGTSAAGYYCFPYISTYGYVNNGVPTYQLQTADGRTVGFSGSPGSVTANADINERVTQITYMGNLAWQVHRSDDSIETYSVTGVLLQRVLLGGRTFTYTYSTAQTPPSVAPTPGLLLSQSDAFGHSLSWQYNSAGQMTQMTDPAGGLYLYAYDSSGNLINVTYPDGTQKTYWYNEAANTGGAALPNALTGITDESGVRYSTYQYNSSGLAVNSQHAGGVESYTFAYPSLHNSTTVTDPLGTTRTYSFTYGNGGSYLVDTRQAQPAASGSGTVSASEAYDANGNVAWHQFLNGSLNAYVYDLTRNLETSRTEAYGTAQARTITTQWDFSWREPSLVTEPNRKTAFTYDGSGNILTKTITDTSVSPNVSRTWTYTYDGYGRMLTAQGPRTDVNSTTTYAYYTCTTGYQCGQLQTVTDPLGHVTTFNTYNAHGQPLTITDPNGVVTTLTYDARLRLTSRQIGTEMTRYSYLPTGLLASVTLPDGSGIAYTYDAAHRLTGIADTLGNSIAYTLDNMGNRTAEKAYDPNNALHRLHTRVVNALNEISQEVNSAGTAAVTTTRAYDNAGNPTNVTAPLARNTANQYDALNRLTQITDPNSGITQLAYDANDNLASVKDPRGLTTTYTHDGFGDLTKLASPDTGATSNTYDSAGNLKTATDARGATATYAYDALNRVTQVAYSDQTINFSYDTGTSGIGHLTGASDANHALSWSYDGLGRVTGKGEVVGGQTLSAGYGYSNGDQVSLVTPSGQTITYGYTNHRVTSIKVNGATLLSGVTYDPFGPPTGWTWGNNTTMARSFDEDGNPSQITAAGATNAYTVDAASRITAISDSGLSSNSWTFGYDSLDRVTSGTSTALSRGYSYDANGNQLTSTGTVAYTDTIATTSNQLTATTGGLSRTYSYDAAGNATGFGANSFTFNQRGRMSAAIATGSSTSYIYNALGQLIEKYGYGGTILLMYDEFGHLIGEYTGSGALIQETVWMGDLPVATIQPSGTGNAVYYVHTDHLGTPRKITRPSDNGLMWRWDPDTFGSVPPNTNPAGLGTFTYNLRFPGQYYMAETGLYYNYFRDYDPATGRYLESDPIGLRAGVNTYSYVGNNAASFFDPYGLCKVEVRFKLATPFDSIPEYHAYIITTDLDGSQQVFRGGPEGQFRWNSPVWGWVHAVHGPYDPSSKDWTAAARPSKVYIDDGKPCECSNQKLANVIDKIDALHIGYAPLGYNSNGVVGTALESLGLSIGTIPVSAPNIDRLYPIH